VLTRTRFVSFLASALVCTSSATACIPSIEYLENAEQVPHQVLERFCLPEPGYDSFLLMQTAINKDSPVFRVIAVRRDATEAVRNVRLYQFDQDGRGHPKFLWQSQAVIDFKGNPSSFTARVKGRGATVSFNNQAFEFDMGGPFGLRIKQDLDATGRITIDQKTASVLLLKTSNRDHWRWVLDSGEQVPF